LIDDSLSATEHDLMNAVRVHHADFAAVLSELMAYPAVGYGEATALLMITAGEEAGAGRRILASVAAVLEIVSLIAALHADLPVDLRSIDSAASWGWATSSVCLADCLNAEALCRIHELPAPIAQRLALVLRRVMREAVVLACSRRGSGDLISICRREVLSAAVIIAGDVVEDPPQTDAIRAGADLPPKGT